MTREEEGLLVTAVNKDGPYGEILSVGDMVLEVAGYQAAQLRAAEFGALLDDGEPHRTVVVRSCALRDWDTSCSEAQR